jgi:site-specific recombinase XerD
MNTKVIDLNLVRQDFLAAKQVEGKSEATLAFYADNLNRFVWWLGHEGLPQELGQIRAPEIRNFLLYVRKTAGRWPSGATSSRNPASMSTVDAYWRTLQAFFSWLVKEETIGADSNPIKKIPRPKVPTKVVQDIPLDLINQALALWGEKKLAHLRNRAILIILLDTGIRLSECARLTLADVDAINGVIKVWGKGNKQRLAHLGGVARKALEAYLCQRKRYQESALWLDEDGKPIGRRGIQAMVRRLKRLGGNVRWSPHTFRNTFAVNYLRAGGDPFTLQILGGWEDLEMPRRYSACLKVEDAFRVHEMASPADRLLRSAQHNRDIIPTCSTKP